MPNERIPGWLHRLWNGETQSFNEPDPVDPILVFCMRANGYVVHNGHWVFSEDSVKDRKTAFTGQRTSFNGPGSYGQEFWPTGKIDGEILDEAFDNQVLLDTIARIGAVDNDQAARTAFILGSAVRYRAEKINPSKTRRFNDKQQEVLNDTANYCASMTSLGDAKSADAIASAMAMHVRSTDECGKSEQFRQYVYRMGEAISEDPIKPQTTADLGISQVARLRRFFEGIHDQQPRPIGPVDLDQVAFEGIPTIGAEFHLPPKLLSDNPAIWQRLALLNMSQYHPDSYIQMSRRDKGMVEVRMNPSIFPVTVANFHYMRRVVPELNRAFFTLTFNQQGKDFSWKNEEDVELIKGMKGLAFASYASWNKEVPPTTNKKETDLGGVYLGQTFKLREGRPEFSGNWSNTDTDNGQLGMYVGYHGDTFDSLAYYLSMAMADPSILNPDVKHVLRRSTSVHEAVKISEVDQRLFFSSVANRINQNPRLRNSAQAGTTVYRNLAPY